MKEGESLKDDQKELWALLVQLKTHKQLVDSEKMKDWYAFVADVFKTRNTDLIRVLFENMSDDNFPISQDNQGNTMLYLILREIQDDTTPWLVSAKKPFFDEIAELVFILLQKKHDILKANQAGIPPLDSMFSNCGDGEFKAELIKNCASEQFKGTSKMHTYY